MPTKLKVLIVLLALGVIAALAEWRLFDALMRGAIVVGVFKGDDAIRKLLIGLAGVGLIWALFVLGFRTPADPLGLATTATGAVFTGFAIWCLTRADVKQWMSERSVGQTTADDDGHHGDDPPG